MSYAHKKGLMHEIYHKSMIYAHICIYMYEISSYMKTFFGSMYELISYMKTFFGSMYEMSSYMKTFFGSMYKISSCYDRGFLIDEIFISWRFHDPYLDMLKQIRANRVKSLFVTDLKSDMCFTCPFSPSALRQNSGSLLGPNTAQKTSKQG